MAKSSQIRKIRRLNKALVAVRQERDRLIQARREARDKRIDKRIERVGRALYGGFWMGQLKKEEWEIAKDSRAGETIPKRTSAGHQPTITIALPSSGKEATTIARARFRYRASDEQCGQVIRWLNDLRILDGSASEFDAWFREQFPETPLSPTEKRRNAVQTALDAGLLPGHGGNIDWKSFRKDVEARTGLVFDEKTIKRDVNDLRGKKDK
jgi:hypothetical protein